MDHRHPLKMWAVLIAVLLSLCSAAVSAQVLDVRTANHGDRSRFVLDLSAPAAIQVFSLHRPERVVVRVKGAGTHVPFTRKSVKDPRVKRIRAGRAKRDLLIVFDLKGHKRFKYFTLGRKGHRVAQRVVVDILGTPAAASKSKHTVATRKPKPRAARQRVKPTRPVKVAQKQKSSPAVSMRKKAHTVSHPKKLQPSQASRNRLREEILRYTRRPLDDRKLIVAIDAGHGGKDTGAIGVGGLKEKDVTLALARELKRQIDRLPNMRAVLIRDGDYFIPLHERPRIAKEKNADVFISLHADAFPSDHRVRGGSIYVLNRRGATTALNRALERSENGSLFVRAQTSPNKVAFILGDLRRKANLQASRGMAKAILKQLSRKVRMHKLSVQSANFAVLRQLDMPSILVETAFISNRHDAANLRSRRFRQRFAQAVALGVKQYALSRGDQPHWGETLFVRYKVRSGDTLSEIAQRFGTRVKTLKRLNRIKRANHLYAGMHLRIPLNDKVVAALN